MPIQYYFHNKMRAVFIVPLILIFFCLFYWSNLSQEVQDEIPIVGGFNALMNNFHMNIGVIPTFLILVIASLNLNEYALTRVKNRYHIWVNTCKILVIISLIISLFYFLFYVIVVTLSTEVKIQTVDFIVLTQLFVRLLFFSQFIFLVKNLIIKPTLVFFVIFGIIAADIVCYQIGVTHSYIVAPQVNTSENMLSFFIIYMLSTIAIAFTNNLFIRKKELL